MSDGEALKSKKWWKRRKRCRKESSCRDIVVYTGPVGFAYSPSDSSTNARDNLFYEILGVDKKATKEELKQAYRRKAIQLHPDKNGGTEQSRQKFITLQRAYSVLSDDNKRIIYDRFGIIGLDVAEHYSEEQHAYMARLSNNRTFHLFLACVGLLTCCFCCFCCCCCCSVCRDNKQQQGPQQQPAEATFVFYQPDGTNQSMTDEDYTFNVSGV